MTYEYTFPRQLDRNQVNSIVILYKWGGDINVNGNRITSQRPMPQGLYNLLSRFDEIKPQPVYHDCLRVYQSLMKRGRETFPEIDHLFGTYGYTANIILAETIVSASATNELKQRLGKQDFEELLQLLLRREFQPRLFD